VFQGANSVIYIFCLSEGLDFKCDLINLKYQNINIAEIFFNLTLLNDETMSDF